MRAGSGISRMRRRRPARAAVALLLLVHTHAVWAGEKLYLFPVEGRKIEVEDKMRLGELVATRLTAYNAFDLLTEDVAKKLLENSKVEMALGDSCSEDQGCVQYLSNLLRSRFFVKVSALGLRDGGIIATAELIDAKAGKIVSKHEWEMSTPIESADEALASALDRLIAPLGAKGELAVKAEVPGSEFSADDVTRPLSPEGTSRLMLPVGTHKLQLTHPDYFPTVEQLLITGGKTQWAPDQISLAERATPWFLSWWFLGSLAVAAGGGTAAYILTRPKEAEELPPLPPLPYASIKVKL